MVNEIVVRIGEGPGFDYQSIQAAYLAREGDLVFQDICLTFMVYPSAMDYNGAGFSFTKYVMDETHFVKVVRVQPEPEPEPEPEEPEEPPPGPLDV